MSITEAKKVVTLLEDILDECEDDHVGLWSVLREVRNVAPDAAAAELKSATLELLRFLLGHNLVEAGFPAPNGSDFEPWRMSPDETFDRIKIEWDALGRDPSPGEIVWFTTPT